MKNDHKNRDLRDTSVVWTSVSNMHGHLCRKCTLFDWCYKSSVGDSLILQLCAFGDPEKPDVSLKTGKGRGTVKKKQTMA